MELSLNQRIAADRGSQPGLLALAALGVTLPGGAMVWRRRWIWAQRICGF